MVIEVKSFRETEKPLSLRPSRGGRNTPLEQPRLLDTSGQFRLEHFDGQHQKRTKWCWAAVAATISDYYHRLGGRPSGTCVWTQCQVASIHEDLSGDVDCCDETSADACNLEYELSKALRAVGHPHHYPVDPDFKTFNFIADEIGRHKRPVPIRMRRRGTINGNSIYHFFIIWGYHWYDQTYLIWDPAGQSQQVSPIDPGDILSETQSVEWTHTYTVDAPEPELPLRTGETQTWC